LGVLGHAQVDRVEPPPQSIDAAGADNADRAAGQVMNMALVDLVVGGMPSLLFKKGAQGEEVFLGILFRIDSPP
jgi:hypothetical protein